MSVLTRYLDLLPDDARERVLTASKWTPLWCCDENGARNLLGHAEDWYYQPGHAPECRAPHVFRLRALAGDEPWTDEPAIARDFQRLVERRGIEQAVALVRAHIRAKVPATNRNNPSRRM